MIRPSAINTMPSRRRNQQLSHDRRDRQPERRPRFIGYPAGVVLVVNCGPYPQHRETKRTVRDVAKRPSDDDLLDGDSSYRKSTGTKRMKSVRADAYDARKDYYGRAVHWDHSPTKYYMY